MIDEDSIRLAVLTDHLDDVDYYALLEVERTAGADEVRESFHRFALRFHPDQHVGDAARQRQAMAIFKRGAEAYRVLMQPALRARYDATLAKGGVRLAPDAMQLPADGVERNDLPPGARVFYDKAVALLAKGDLGGAKLHLSLAVARGESPRFDALARQIRDAAAKSK